MKIPRRKIDAALKVKIALETLREQATVAELAQLSFFQLQILVGQPAFKPDTFCGY
jgi:hypothetical protein